MESWVTGVAACMQESGWDVQADAQLGSISNDTLPVQQRSSFKQALRGCEKAAGPQPNADSPSRDRVVAIYAHLVKMRSCLSANGFSSDEPPSEGAFVDEYLSGRAGWNPYNQLPPTLSQAAFEELERQCPQTPPG